MTRKGIQSLRPVGPAPSEPIVRHPLGCVVYVDFCAINVKAPWLILLEILQKEYGKYRPKKHSRRRKWARWGKQFKCGLCAYPNPKGYDRHLLWLPSKLCTPSELRRLESAIECINSTFGGRPYNGISQLEIAFDIGFSAMSEARTACRIVTAHQKLTWGRRGNSRCKGTHYLGEARDPRKISNYARATSKHPSLQHPVAHLQVKLGLGHTRRVHIYSLTDLATRIENEGLWTIYQRNVFSAFIDEDALVMTAIRLLVRNGTRKPLRRSLELSRLRYQGWSRDGQAVLVRRILNARLYAELILDDFKRLFLSARVTGSNRQLITIAVGDAYLLWINNPDLPCPRSDKSLTWHLKTWAKLPLTACKDYELDLERSDALMTLIARTPRTKIGDLVEECGLSTTPRRKPQAKVYSATHPMILATIADKRVVRKANCRLPRNYFAAPLLRHVN